MFKMCVKEVLLNYYDGCSDGCRDIYFMDCQ